MTKFLALLFCLTLLACAGNRNSVFPFYEGLLGQSLTLTIDRQGTPSQITSENFRVEFIYSNVSWQGYTGDLVFSANSEGILDAVVFTLHDVEREPLLERLASIFTELEPALFATEMVAEERAFYLEHLPEEYEAINEHFDNFIEQTRQMAIEGTLAIFRHGNYIIQFSDVSNPFFPDDRTFQLIFFEHS